MLPKAHRLTKSDEIRSVIRQGKRSSCQFATIHYVPGTGRAAFVTPKTIGNAVVRNLIRRRSREILRSNLDCITGKDLVVRLHPASSTARFADLSESIGAALRKLD